LSHIRLWQGLDDSGTRFSALFVEFPSSFGCGCLRSGYDPQRLRGTKKSDFQCCATNGRFCPCDFRHGKRYICRAFQASPTHPFLAHRPEVPDHDASVTIQHESLPGVYYAKQPSSKPSDIQARAGGKLKDAVVLAARAHSMLSPSETMEVVLAFGGGMYGPPNMAGALEIVKSMGRAFDVEHEKSVPILNELVDKVARAAHLPTFVVSRGREQAVSEEASHLTDHMQAADLAAGWAADLLLATNGNYRALAKQFRWVGVNGIAIPE
jgi:hypothetical protein